MKRAITLGLLLVVCACVKKPPEALATIRAAGWRVEQLDDRVSVHRPGCTDADLAALVGDARGLKHLTVDVAGSSVTDAGIDSLAALGDAVVGLDVSSTAVTLAPVSGLEQLQVLKMAKSGATDLGLRHLSAMKELRLLVLDDCPGIDGSGLHHLAGLVSLESLYLRRTPVTDAGLQTLPRLPKLRRLFLDGTAITAASLDRLGELPSLDELGLEDVAGIAEEALDAFEESNPDIQVNRS